MKSPKLVLSPDFKLYAVNVGRCIMRKLTKIEIKYLISICWASESLRAISVYRKFIWCSKLTFEIWFYLPLQFFAQKSLKTSVISQTRKVMGNLSLSDHSSFLYWRASTCFILIYLFTIPYKPIEVHWVRGIVGKILSYPRSEWWAGKAPEVNLVNCEFSYILPTRS